MTPYSTSSPVAITPPGNIVFTENGSMSGITHTPGTAQVLISQTGEYTISYSVSISNDVDVSVAIAVNDTVVSSTTTPAHALPGTYSASVILLLVAGDTVTLTVE